MRHAPDKLIFDNTDRYIAPLPSEAPVSSTVPMFDIAQRSLKKHTQGLINILGEDVTTKNCNAPESPLLPALLNRVEHLQILTFELADLAAPIIVEALHKNLPTQ
ncbi:MAG: hypothetical protein JWL89_247 [Candidatus Saccharibacteria bacterium]|nr:hypothetical protein [Candidatus Saccharibacteria bacterium]